MLLVEQMYYINKFLSTKKLKREEHAGFTCLMKQAAPARFFLWDWINPEVDREIRRHVKQHRLWRALHGMAVSGVFFDPETTRLRLKVTCNGRDFVTMRIDPRTLDFSTSPAQPDEIWLSLHYRWLRVDHIHWQPDLLSIQCTGDWTTFINVKRSNRRSLWHLWLPF